MQTAGIAVRFDRISKSFPGTQALSDVTIDVAAGSCHAFCGENGAGKSTLGKILAGVHRPDAGQLIVLGVPRRFASPRDALHTGVGMVYQEPSFCNGLSVAENLCLGVLPSRLGFVQRDDLYNRARELLRPVDARIDVRRAVGTLGVAQQQLMQIAIAVAAGAQVIVFDEPTSSLSHAESERLFSLIGELKSRGVTCIYVSHRMPEVFRLCDTISVLRDGHHVATNRASDMTQQSLVQLMVGRPVGELSPGVSGESAPEVLRVEAMSSPGKLHDVSFALRRGEVLGVTGLLGAGRTELARALFGLDRDARGRVFLDEKEVQIRSPMQAIRLGLGLVPEDRKAQGIVPAETAEHNASLPILKRLSNATFVRTARERAVLQEYFDRLRVRVTARRSAVGRLSGGNQQKIILMRWLAARSRILILDEPTRGVDVGAKSELHALILELTSKGTSVLLMSSELPEVLSLASRILILREGRIVAERPSHGATQEELLRLMSGD
ncbi:MAG: sugar ABC transporter ATP-binding protein [Gemmatimonadaceae bacterium]